MNTQRIEQLLPSIRKNLPSTNINMNNLYHVIYYLGMTPDNYTNDPFSLTTENTDSIREKFIIGKLTSNKNDDEINSIIRKIFDKIVKPVQKVTFYYLLTEEFNYKGNYLNPSEKVTALLNSVKLDDPFDTPITTNVNQTLLEVNKLYWPLSKDGKSTLNESSTYNESRSLSARIGGLCESAIDTKDGLFLRSIIAIYDICSFQIECQGLIVKLALFRHAWIRVNGQELDIENQPEKDLSEKFTAHLIKFQRRTEVMKNIQAYELKEIRSDDKTKIVWAES